MNVDGGPNIDYVLSILLYADDIVCMAESEIDLQSILLIIEKWCKKWRLEVNLSKTNIIHIRNSRKMQSKFTFLFDMRPVPYCTFYKYLGVNINEYLDFTFTVEKHTDAAGRALGAIVTKMIKNGGFPYNVYSLLYNACVTSVSDYSGPITGYLQFDSSLQIHLRAIRAFLGVPKNTCNVGVLSEVDLLLPHYRTRIQMIRQYHRMICMDSDRLTKQIFVWDKTLNDSGLVSTWTSEIKSIFQECNLNLLYETSCPFELKYVVANIIDKFKSYQNDFLSNECAEKPKLRTFILFKNFSEIPSYIVKPLTFYERRMMAKTRLGCLPIRLETARYLLPRLPEEERYCLVCRNFSNPSNNPILDHVESEIHYLFSCAAYRAERDEWLSKLTLPPDFDLMPTDWKLKVALNDPLNVKLTSKFITNAYNIRSKILNQKQTNIP